ncbi:MAG: transcription-repair coupling factor [Gammaproteobacteria bacterium]
MPESYQHLLLPPLPRGAQALGWSHLHGSAAALAVAEAAQLHAGVLVAVFEDQRQLQICENELRFFLAAGREALVFPSWECLPYDVFSPHQDIISQRLRVLSGLPAMRRAIVLTTSANLMQRLPPPEYVLGHSFSLRRGQRIDLGALRAQLSDANYAAVQQVMSPGEFALRGGLVDVFPMGADAPFRLDLFDDEIETIRYFDPDTQRSRRDVEEISLLPAREFPMNESGIRRFRQAFRRLFEGDPRAQKIYTEISDGRAPPGAEFFLPLFFENTCTLFDYVRGEQLWLLPEGFEAGAKTQWAEIQDRYTNANYDSERRALPPQMLHLAPQELQQHLARHPRILRMNAANAHSGWRAPCAPSMQFPVDAREESPYRHLLEHIARAENRLLLAVETAGRREAMEEMLANHGLRAAACDGFAAFVRDPAAALGLCVYPLERGLCLPDCGIEVISESQLYGEKVRRRRRAAKAQDPEAVIRSLAELHEDDPVVHIEHGVGRYRGLQFLDIDGRATEFLALEYRDGDKLYVPVLSLHLIGRFVGGGKEHAPLHRLGGEQWQKARRRAREKAYDVAAELLEIEALRSARDGRVFVVPEEEYQGFVGRFAFEETHDQQRAIDEVRADLESPEPMDRLVCGDVGFGKTEVALRAAFIAVHNDCQVAVLTPTTLLAQQHHQTFTDRFADLSVTVEMLSRFKTKKQAAAIIAELTQGRPDIIIGTHRLLQDDVQFKRLGLLIIDEEHRFGVRQKEKIKQLRSQVDLLTLTATPIPRTLNLAMAGLRAISLIATAPELRLSIKTFICESSSGLIREALLREIRRGGQVYFLYNEVRSIERFTADLAELVPEAEVNFGHGQMGEARLERVMQDFYHRRFNVLVCSTIIESGLDIPSANTIIIHRADRFGLAQLHQLRGRVGRSHHQAFAYLLIPERRMLRGDAKKRLDAFSQMDELGSGFTLASHDLDIRGAGELLGETQSGLIDEVGFALYAEYLSMAVAAIKENHIAPPDETPPVSSVDLHLPALFPPDYLANPHARLILYKRIAGAADRHELDELQIEVIDRFGLLPPPGKNLFRLTALRLRAQRLGIHKIEIGEAGGVLEFTEQPALDPAAALALVRRAPHEYRFQNPASLAVTRDFSDEDTRIAEVERLLDELSGGAAGATLQ